MSTDFIVSILYPCLEFFYNSSRAKVLREKLPFIGDSTIRVLQQQWNRPAESGKLMQEYSKHFSVWADYAYLQYASSVAIITGSLAHVIVVGGEHVVHWPLTLLCCLLVVAGLMSDWRLHRVREYLGVHSADDS
jgi:hypothetical protein